MAWLARTADDAARDLADMSEWAAAGLILRVASVIRSGEKARVAIPFAAGARVCCLTSQGRALCSLVIDNLDAIAAKEARA